MNKIEIFNSPDTEPNKRNLWLKNGTLKYFSNSGWKTIEASGNHATAHVAQGGADIDIDIPISNDTTLGGVRVMDKDASHLIISPEGNLYVYSTDNYTIGASDSPDMIPTLAALHSLSQDVIMENTVAYLSTGNDATYPLTVQGIADKLNQLIANLQDAKIMKKNP